jgi:hypothetical protein
MYAHSGDSVHEKRLGREAQKGGIVVAIAIDLSWGYIARHVYSSDFTAEWNLALFGGPD